MEVLISRKCSLLGFLVALRIASVLKHTKLYVWLLIGWSCERHDPARLEATQGRVSGVSRQATKQKLSDLKGSLGSPRIKIDKGVI